MQEKRNDIFFYGQMELRDGLLIPSTGVTSCNGLKPQRIVIETKYAPLKDIHSIDNKY